MESKATSKFNLISPRKVRLVADEVRGFTYPEAIDMLRFIPRKASGLLENVLKSARANALQMDENIRDEELFIKKLYVDEGPTLKRFRPRARGRGVRILKRTSHITAVLSND
ncbi:MAG: 50S ribosomal protein L22 [Leptospiraceae bacterium]|nr:50S ribosomal protein L22 [Leptospiraceae bacterium]MCB1322575.1 50S ribosomal protein L22 [Leptospiraceae bacterium]